MSAEPAIRLCSTCRVLKPETDFYFRNRARTLRQYCCKACKSEYNRRWYEGNRAKHIADVRRNNELYRAQAARIALEAKDQPCSDCGERFDPCAMDFDHVRGVKVAAVSELVRAGAKPDVIRREIAKCEVVCSNCHRIRTQARGWGQQGSPENRADVAADGSADDTATTLFD